MFSLFLGQKVLARQINSSRPVPFQVFLNSLRSRALFNLRGGLSRGLMSVNRSEDCFERAQQSGSAGVSACSRCRFFGYQECAGSAEQISDCHRALDVADDYCRNHLKQTCTDGDKERPVGFSRCSGSKIWVCSKLQVISEKFDWVEGLCPNGQQCLQATVDSPGVCVDLPKKNTPPSPDDKNKICVEGDSRCVGDQVQEICKDDAWIKNACPVNFQCVEGGIVSAGCRPITCEGGRPIGSRYCSDDKIVSCGSDGKPVIVRECLFFDEKCQMSGGVPECRRLDCGERKSGDTKCSTDGKAIETCLGGNWVKSISCYTKGCEQVTDRVAMCVFYPKTKTGFTR